MEQLNKNELIAEAVSEGLLSYEQARLFDSFMLDNLLEMVRAIKQPAKTKQSQPMTREFHLFGFKQAVMRRLDAIEAKLDHLIMVLSNVEVTSMSVKTAVESLKQDVANETSQQQSLITLLSGLADQLRQALDNDDEQALEDLHTQMTTNATALAAAVAANTPTPAPVANEDTGARPDVGASSGVGGAGPSAASTTQASRTKTVAP